MDSWSDGLVGSGLHLPLDAGPGIKILALLGSQWGREYVTALLRLCFPICRLKGLLTAWSAWLKQELACLPLPPALPPWSRRGPGPLSTEA